MDLAKSTRVGLAIAACNKAWLARKLDVTQQYIGQVCNGKTKPSTEMIERLSVAFGVDVSQFIEWGE